MKGIAALLDEAAQLGLDRIIFPIDILKLANDIAGHPDKRKAVDGLIEWLGHESNSQRHVALRALRLIGPDALSRGLVGLALAIVKADDAPNVRAEAVRLVAASGVKTRRVRDALAKAAAQDDTDYVRREAAHSLGKSMT
jgi:HEAT repeat protein